MSFWTNTHLCCEFHENRARRPYWSVTVSHILPLKRHILLANAKCEDVWNRCLRSTQGGPVYYTLLLQEAIPFWDRHSSNASGSESEPRHPHSKLEKLCASLTKIENKTRVDKCKTRDEQQKCGAQTSVPNFFAFSIIAL